MQKRALPARHSFLTDAVRATLEQHTDSPEPCVDVHTVLAIVAKIDSHSCSKLPIPPSPMLPKPKPMPGFKQLPRQVTPRAISQTPSGCEPLLDEYYVRRHRKHELEEKKHKNREKERLQHEFYQQQQLVEKIRALDRSTLMSIVSSLRQADQSDTSIIDIDVIRQQLLHGAEYQLHRYEMLGLGRGSGAHLKKTEASTKDTNDSGSEKKNNSICSNSDRVNAQKSKKTAPTTTRKRAVVNRSLFGEQVPHLKNSNFSLPKRVYGTLMKSRRDRWKNTNDQ